VSLQTLFTAYPLPCAAVLLPYFIARAASIAAFLFLLTLGAAALTPCDVVLTVVVNSVSNF